MTLPSSRVVAAGTGAALVAAALSLATPEIMRWEGRRNAPYRDVVGVPTVCYGDTQVPMRHYSDAECAAMLARRAEHDYARPILQCVPALRNRPYSYAAAISLSYNIGVGAFCRSTTARFFKAGQWRKGCDAMVAWNRAGGRILPGLTRRRQAERRLCLRSIATKDSSRPDQGDLPTVKARRA